MSLVIKESNITDTHNCKTMFTYKHLDHKHYYFLFLTLVLILNELKLAMDLWLY